MKRVSIGTLIVIAVLSLLTGGIAGFFLGVAATNFGEGLLKGMVEEETRAETEHPTRLVRDGFELLHPANWKVDVNDDDYDPDHLFSIESPGATFVMFVLGNLESDPQDALQAQLDAFSKVMESPDRQSFETYGRFQGKGAILRGRILGTKVTVRIFACCRNGTTAIIVQQCPDEDHEFVKDGLRLIEESFRLKPVKKQDAQE